MNQSKSFANMDVFLIVLEGQGDLDVGLVNQETFDWINSDFNSDQSFYIEQLPDSILNAYDEKHNGKVNVTRGSYDNDRAIQSPKMSFNSLKDALTYIKENNCNLAGEFVGAIY